MPDGRRSDLRQRRRRLWIPSGLRQHDPEHGLSQRRLDLERQRRRGTTAVERFGVLDAGGEQFHQRDHYLFNGPERTEQAIFGAGNGTAGTVTLGSTVPVDQIIFNAAGSGTYTIASSGSNVISFGRWKHHHGQR